MFWWKRMQCSWWRAAPARAAFIALALLASATVCAAAGFDEHRSFTAHELYVADLIGEVTVQGTDGPRFEVDVSVQGKDASRERIQIVTREGDRAELVVKFPLGEKGRYVYPGLGERSHTVFTASDEPGGHDHLLEKIFEGLTGRTVRVSGSGSGLEVWADVTIRVPRGQRCEVELGVGAVKAEDLTADLICRTHSGPVSARKVRGRLSVDTGSGRVTVKACGGPRIDVDTGSGAVRLEDVECQELAVDTGSGGVEGLVVRADAVSIDTGSGTIDLRLERMGQGPFDLETGSGGIELRLPADASAEVVAETGSGGIDVDVDHAELLHHEDDEVRFRVGGGEARVQLETGSGSINISG